MEVLTIEQNTSVRADAPDKGQVDDSQAGGFRKALEKVREKDQPHERQKQVGQKESESERSAESDKAAENQIVKRLRESKKTSGSEEEVQGLAMSLLLSKILAATDNKASLLVKQPGLLDDLKVLISDLRLLAETDKKNPGLKTQDLEGIKGEPGKTIPSGVSSSVRAEALEKVSRFLQKYPALSDLVRDEVKTPRTQSLSEQKPWAATDNKAIQIAGLNIQFKQEGKAAGDRSDKTPEGSTTVIRGLTLKTGREDKGVTETQGVMLQENKDTLFSNLILQRKSGRPETVDMMLHPQRNNGPEVIQNPLNARIIELRLNPDMAVADASGFRSRIMEQIENAIKVQFNPPQNEVRIRLNPPSLGEVTIKIQVIDDKTQAGKQMLAGSMVVESEGVKDALMAGATQLRQSIQDSTGLQMKDFSVMVRSNQDFAQQRNNEPSQQQRRKKSEAGSEDSDDLAGLLDRIDFNLQGILNYIV